MDEQKELRKRLEALNRAPMPEGETAEADVEGIRRRIRKMRERTPSRADEAILYRRDLPRDEGAAERRRLAGPPVALEEAVEGEEAAAPEGGSAYVVTTRLGECEGGWTELCETFRRRLASRDSPLQRRIGASCQAGPVSPEELVFLDLETTGLGSTPLFLVGTMAWRDGDLVVRQYFARHYGEERAAISLFLREAAGRRLLVSFNGKSFDLPYVRVRAAANALPFALDLPHLDLLHESRRAWGGRLADCRLQTLETCICGRRRRSDIPGAEIPDAYHAFVRTGNAAEMVEVLQHNMLDLVTLADLMTRLPEPR